MIVLDTHIWIWWIQGDTRLDPIYRNYVQTNEPFGLGVSIISCWEVAKLDRIARECTGKIARSGTATVRERRVLADAAPLYVDLRDEER